MFYQKHISFTKFEQNLFTEAIHKTMGRIEKNESSSSNVELVSSESTFIIHHHAFKGGQRKSSPQDLKGEEQRGCKMTGS